MRNYEIICELCETNLMENIKIKLIKRPEELNDAYKVRKLVFQKEQGIDKRLDFDGKDEALYHIVAYYNDNPIGTTRIQYLNNGKSAKIERTAVLQNYRGYGVGKQIIKYTIDYLKEKRIEKVILNAQEHAKGFYEKLGFKQEGEIFKEAGLPHVRMHKELVKNEHVDK